uniref:Uncharacterized protein n=1 Tax=Panagrolaimus davidi TaxID=227884 RepID=A0A914P5V2_9BILA
MAQFWFLSIFFVFKFITNVWCQNDSTIYSFNPASIRLTRLSSLFDLMPKRQCTHSKAQLCFSEAYAIDFLKRSCLDFVAAEFSPLERDSSIQSEYTTEFQEPFIECLIKKTKNFTTLNENEIVFIPALEDEFYNIQYEESINQTFQTEHEKCLKKKVLTCFQRQNCFMKSHEKVIHEIFPFCRFETLENMDIKNISPPELVTKSRFETFDELSEQTIEYFPDLSTNLLPQKTIEIFQNLTYGHLEAIKVYLLCISELKKGFCNPAVSLDFYIQPSPKKTKIFSNIPEEFPFIPSETAKILSSLTYQDFVAVKSIVNIDSHYRWILCSPIVGISPPMKVSINQYIKPQKIERSKLEKCRDIVKKEEDFKSFICN